MQGFRYSKRSGLWAGSLGRRKRTVCKVDLFPARGTDLSKNKWIQETGLSVF